MKLLATFYSHFGAVRFMNKCKSAECVAKMMPVPRNLSSSCGTCVSYECDRLWPGMAADAEDASQTSDVGADTGTDIGPDAKSDTSIASMSWMQEVEQIVEVAENGYRQLYRAKDS